MVRSFFMYHRAKFHLKFLSQTYAQAYSLFVIKYKEYF